jgi:hypothetical protein
LRKAPLALFSAVAARYTWLIWLCGGDGSMSWMGVEMHLVPETVLERLAADLDEQWVREHVAPSYWAYREMRFERALAHLPDRLPAEHRDEVRIYYTRLYWARCLVAVARRALGPDAGLEQWAHRILECAPDAEVDWEIVQEIFQSTSEVEAS